MKKIKYTYGGWTATERPSDAQTYIESVEEFVKYTKQGTYKATKVKTIEILAGLIDVLVQKKILDLDDLMKITKQIYPNQYELIEVEEEEDGDTI